MLKFKSTSWKPSLLQTVTNKVISMSSPTPLHTVMESMVKHLLLLFSLDIRTKIYNNKVIDFDSSSEVFCGLPYRYTCMV